MTNTIKVGMVSLGCPKNQMDAELMLASLANAGYELTADAALADVVVINTCGFIEDAKQEGIETILEFAKLKDEGRIMRIVVTGCMAERYREELARELPECDAVIGLGANGSIADTVAAAVNGERPLLFPEKSSWPLDGARVLTTPAFFAYLRIADGCDNRCAYCAIPLIRGPLRSREMETLVSEARALASGGVRELVLVAQDTTMYGMDIYGRPALAELLERLCEIDGLHWIRLLYCYPEHITPGLLSVIASNPKIVKYLDIPVQHADGGVLRAMNRRGDAKSLLSIIENIRKAVPGIALRTTVMTGFPGEDEDAFNTLCDFVSEARFERLGCFAFSPEEDTPAAALPGQIEPELKNRRRDIIMADQSRITEKFNQSRVGSAIEVLVEECDRYASDDDIGQIWFGRSAADAPDIDCKVFFSAEPGQVHPGDFVNITVTGVMDYDLMGDISF